MAIEIKVVSGYEELERWVAARNEVVPDDTDTVELKALLRASQAGRLDLIAYEGGEVVGTGLLAGDEGTLSATHPYVEVMVPPRHRGRGVGTALLKTFSAHLRDLGRQGLQVEARSDDPYSLEYLQRRGFVEVDRWTQLVLDLATHDPEPPAFTHGVELAWLSERPDLLEDLFSLAVGTMRDQTGSLHAWQVYELGDPRIRLDLTALAVDGGNVVGYTTFMQFLEERTGCHRVLIIRPGERAVGAALIRAQIASAKEAGFESLFAWARPWQHHALYESLGYEARTASIDFKGPLQ
jgi:N-acetylglutamate synthase-like GNAT family acetyltransferase